MTSTTATTDDACPAGIDHDAECIALDIEPRLGAAALAQLADDPATTDEQLRRCIRTLSESLTQVQRSVQELLLEVGGMQSWAVGVTKCRCWECLHSENGNEPASCGCATHWAADADLGPL